MPVPGVNLLDAGEDFLGARIPVDVTDRTTAQRWDNLPVFIKLRRNHDPRMSLMGSNHMHQGRRMGVTQLPVEYRHIRFKVHGATKGTGGIKLPTNHFDIAAAL